jgi:hypothetical protein
MKYIITESQFKLISEIERNWRDFEYEEQYNKIKDKIIPYIVRHFDSYDYDREGNLNIFDSDEKLIAKFHFYEDDDEGTRGELYFSRDHDEMFERTFLNINRNWQTCGNKIDQIYDKESKEIRKVIKVLNS